MGALTTRERENKGGPRAFQMRAHEQNTKIGANKSKKPTQSCFLGAFALFFVLFVHKIAPASSARASKNKKFLQRRRNILARARSAGDAHNEREREYARRGRNFLFLRERELARRNFARFRAHER